MTADTSHILLKRYSVQPTAHRLAILSVFRDATAPLDGQTVYEILLRQGAGIDRATVFRTLKTFERAGLVQPLEFNEGKVRFELNRGMHHHHLVCTECGSIQCLKQCELDGMVESIKRETGFSASFHRLDFFGTCAKCRKEE
ncbi:MAG: transcriptional repressor [Patescibacteria group bacterium]|nr:transcriptional repressor [Patescibacteria group bacterium]